MHNVVKDKVVAAFF